MTQQPKKRPLCIIFTSNFNKTQNQWLLSSPLDLVDVNNHHRLINHHAVPSNPVISAVDYSRHRSCSRSRPRQPPRLRHLHSRRLLFPPPLYLLLRQKIQQETHRPVRLQAPSPVLLLRPSSRHRELLQLPPPRPRGLRFRLSSYPRQSTKCCC